MQRALLVPLTILFIAGNLSAQNTMVTGRVLNKINNKAIEFASVLIKNKSDSTRFFVTTTDSSGNFVFENISTGTWMLKCSFIGFEIKDTTITIDTEQKKIHAGNIKIISTATNLKEVLVSAEGQKLMAVSIDKKIYNVDQDIQASTGSASDVLKNIPSIEVDIDGNVSLRGSGNILFLVDGKLSPLLERTPAEALQNLPASSIERIEVITNPSARYKPDGTGGIINIVMKKNTKTGFNGSIAFNAGNSDRYNGNLMLSYKPGKLNVYGNFGMRQNTHTRGNTDNRDYFDSTGKITSVYDENNIAHGKSFSQTAIFGLDCEIDSSNSISLSGNVFHFNVDRDNTASRKLFDGNSVLTQDYEYFSNLIIDETEMEGSLAWEHKFKKEEHTLVLECVGVIQDEHEDRRNTTSYFFPTAHSSSDNTFLNKKDNPAEIVLDYTNPISEDIVVEAGYSGTFNNIHVDNQLEFFDTLSQGFIKDNSTSYIFKYNDMVNSAYITWEQSIEDFGFLAGLRMEHANLEGNVVTIDSTFKNEYFSLYPSLHLLYEMENGELGLSYSKRVNRPDGDELNPFPEYDDPRNLYAGNPKLLPEYIHSVELGYDMTRENFSFIPALYYRYTYNGFTEVTIPLSDSVLLTTQQNLSSDQSAGLEMIFSGKVCKWMSGNFSSNIFYKQIDASNLGYDNNKSTFSFNTNLNANIKVGTHTMFQVGGNYRSEELTPQGKSFPNFNMNIAAKQDFGNKFSVVLTLNDVLKTQKYETQLDSPELRQHTVRTRDSRILFLGIKYRFGAVTKKSKEETVQFDINEK